jgi:hypothetical protein
MTTVSLEAPQNVGTRDLVRAWVSSAVPDHLSGSVVVVNCAGLSTPTPSFLDELLKILVVERGASRLTITNASERARVFAARSSENRHIQDRIEIVEAAPVRRGLLRRVVERPV